MLQKMHFSKNFRDFSDRDFSVNAKIRENNASYRKPKGKFRTKKYGKILKFFFQMSNSRELFHDHAWFSGNFKKTQDVG